MSKIIKITPEHIEQAKIEFDKYLETAKLSDGKIAFNKALGNVDGKASLIFTEMAWLKMQTLVREFSKEIAWHGVAYRGDDPKLNEYLVTDILVYPQTVTGTSVDMNETEYANWLVQNIDDDRFFNIHFQAHSHVHMATTPSGVDLNHQEEILNMLDSDEGFYIFAIWNKRNERTVRIFDMKKNIMFENADVTVSILNDGTGLESFLAEAKELVRENKTQTPATTSNGAYKSAGGAASYYQQQCSMYGNQNSQSDKKEEKKGSENTGKGKRVKDYKSDTKTGKSKGAYDYYDGYDDPYNEYYGYGRGY